MAPGPEQKRLRSAVSVLYNTPYSTRSGIGGGAPCFWHGGQGTRGMLSQLSKPHFGLLKRRGTTPQAFTAVRAAGTSGVSPPPQPRRQAGVDVQRRLNAHLPPAELRAPWGEEVAATSTYHTRTTAWQPQRGAGICYQHRVAPCGFTHREFSVVAGRAGVPQTAVAVYATAVLTKQGSSTTTRTARPPLPESRAPKMLHPPELQLPLHDHRAPLLIKLGQVDTKLGVATYPSRTPTRCHPVLYLDPAHRAGASRAAPAGTAVYLLVVLTCTGARTRAKALAVRGQCSL